MTRSPRFLTFSLALLSTAAFAQLHVTIEPFQRAGDKVTALVVLSNDSGRDVENAEVELVLTSGRPATLTAGPHPGQPHAWSCVPSGPQSVRCRLPLIHGVKGSYSPLLATIEPAVEGRFALTGSVTWTLDGVTSTSAPYTARALYQREIVVSNTRDAGDGSFRAAIEYANDVCARDQVPCKFRFQFAEPVPQQGWYTIRPLTPFPPITAPDLEIDYTGDAINTPRLEIDGSLLAAGHGFDVRGAGPLIIAHLFIGGFPWDGIAITRPGGVGVFLNTIGLRPNKQPNPNGSRGITVATPAADVALISNRCSANRRSGIFIYSGERITIDTSIMGQFIFEVSPVLLGNGASGIYVGPTARDVLIRRTSAGGNAHMGIAIARGARGVRVEDSWLDPNSGLAIDHGLDGPDGAVRRPQEFALPPPRITSATYDAATGKTTIRGTFDAPIPDATWKLTIFGGVGLWPEFELPEALFTGNEFTVTLQRADIGRPELVRLTAGPVGPSDWSTSELSEPFAVSGNKLLSTVLRSR